MLTHSIGSFFSSTLGFFLLTFCNILFLFNRFLLDAAFHVFVCKRQSRLALCLLCLLQLSPSSPPPPEVHNERVSWCFHCSAGAPWVAVLTRSVLITLWWSANSPITQILRYEHFWRCCSSLYAFNVGGKDMVFLRLRHNIYRWKYMPLILDYKTDSSPSEPSSTLQIILPWSKITNLTFTFQRCRLFKNTSY